MSDIQTILRYFSSIVTGPVSIAFSGGADSVLVLKLALEASCNRFPVYAVYVDTPWMSRHALEEAQQIAQELQADFNVIPIDSTAEFEIDKNPTDRCYRCKKAIFSTIRTFGLKRGADILLEGTQLDDLDKYRPGLKAVAESNAISPLRDLGLRKSDVRLWLKHFNLSTAQKPSGSCLATRIPYGQTLSPTLLSKIESAENYLAQFDLGTIRVRSHGEIARIEVDKDKIENAAAIRTTIINKLKSFGWKYVTLDLEGFRSGSMD